MASQENGLTDNERAVLAKLERLTLNGTPSPYQMSNFIELNRGIRGGYGWSIKVNWEGAVDGEAIDRLCALDERLRILFHEQ